MERGAATSPDASLPEGRITDEALEELRRRVGARLTVRQFNELASRDAIRKFADGIGDPNPLWRDEDYARKTRYGGVVAPPSWLYSVFPTWVLHGLKGVHAFHAGNDWEFYKPVYAGDVIRGECVFRGFEEKRSEFAGRTVIEHQEALYHNQRGELVAKARAWIVRAERAAARSRGKYAELKLPHPWSEEELRRIEEEVLREQLTGSHTRYWEDVRVGEELPPLVKGPLGVTDMIAWCVGSSPVPLLAHGLALRLYRKHPAWAFRDPTTQALEPIYSVHYNLAAARAAGLPYPYDVGVQRQSWLLQLLTNWVGDDGWVKRCYAEYRRFVYLSDAVRLTGRVTAKYVGAGGEHCVDIETHAVNQRGEDTMPGRATVLLPSRESGWHPLEGRLRRP